MDRTRKLLLVLALVGVVLGVHTGVTSDAGRVKGDPSGAYDPETVLDRVEQLRGLNATSEVRIVERRATNDAVNSPDSLDPSTTDALLLGSASSPAVNAWVVRRPDHYEVHIQPPSAMSDTFDAPGVTATGAELQEFVLAHEMAHVVQYDWHLTDHRPADTTDGRLARTAVVEGDATLVQVQYADRYLGTDAAGLERRLAEPNEGAWNRRLFGQVYYLGYRYYVGRNLTFEERNRVLVDPPETTAEILHPEANLSHPGAPLANPPRVDGYRLNGTNRLGELVVRLTLAEGGLSDERAASAAAGWRNDSVAVYEGRGVSVVYVQVRMSNRSEAARLADAWRAMLRASGGRRANGIYRVPQDGSRPTIHQVVERQGAVVEVVASNSESAVRDVVETVSRTDDSARPAGHPTPPVTGGAT
jgi:hypothetical protein